MCLELNSSEFSKNYKTDSPYSEHSILCPAKTIGIAIHNTLEVGSNNQPHREVSPPSNFKLQLSGWDWMLHFSKEHFFEKNGFMYIPLAFLYGLSISNTACHNCRRWWRVDWCFTIVDSNVGFLLPNCFTSHTLLMVSKNTQMFKNFFHSMMTIFFFFLFSSK